MCVASSNVCERMWFDIKYYTRGARNRHTTTFRMLFSWRSAAQQQHSNFLNLSLFGCLLQAIGIIICVIAKVAYLVCLASKSVWVWFVIISFEFLWTVDTRQAQAIVMALRANRDEPRDALDGCIELHNSCHCRLLPAIQPHSFFSLFHFPFFFSFLLLFHPCLVLSVGS